MDPVVLAEIKSRPFTWLQGQPRGSEIIAKILSLAVEPVDIFVTRRPSDAKHHRFITPAGPSSSWKDTHGYKYQAGKVDEKVGLSFPGEEVNAAGEQVPTWYVVRKETKLNLVCKSWKAVLDEKNTVVSINQSHF